MKEKAPITMTKKEVRRYGVFDEDEGVIERANKTLQDRLVKALRFHGITTRIEANNSKVGHF